MLHHPTQHFWDTFANLNTLANPIEFDETGTPHIDNDIFGSLVATGTNTFGTQSVKGTLGATNDAVAFGESEQANSSWIEDASDNTMNGHSLYAMSGVLTVPEPSTLVLVCLSAAGLAVASFRRHRHRRS